MYFLYSRWLQLPLPTRHAIAKILDIPKTGQTHVQDNRIVSDGYPIEEVERALESPRLQEILGTQSDNAEELWNLLIEKATYVEPKPVQTFAAKESEPVIEKPQTVEESNAKPEKIKVIKAPAPDKPAKVAKKTAKKASKKTKK